MTRIDNIAREMGFMVKRISESEAAYYLVDAKGFDVKNAKGEALCVEIGTVPERYPIWWVSSSVRVGMTWEMKYNPCHRWDGHRMVWAEGWKLSATPENFRRILEEVKQRFLNN